MTPHHVIHDFLAPLRASVLWPGLQELGLFIGTHLIGGLIPAFLLAGAICVFLDRRTVSCALGERASPFFAYPLSATIGLALTFCSCGVIPVFAALIGHGAGIGPAFTLLVAAPSVNSVSLAGSAPLFGPGFPLWRMLFAIFSGVTGWGRHESPLWGSLVRDRGGRTAGFR